MYLSPFKSIVCGFLALLVSHANLATAEDWPRFRGTNGSGVASDEVSVPTTWNPDQNLKWKTPLPGGGVSSPIVVGGRVFVTCYSGYGLNRDAPGDLKDLKRHLVCFDAQSGKEIWQKSVDAVQPEDPYEGIGVTAHGYASHTPVSDGKHVYVFFGKSGIIAFDLNGNQIWQRNVGTSSDPWSWGSSSSPVIYKNLVIVTAAAESESLIALNAETGEEVWKEKASGFVGMWGTPLLVTTPERTELVMSVPYELWSFDPETGKLLWYCEASEADQAHASAVSSDGVVYAVTGRGGGSIAVRVGGKDDVSKSHVVWTAQQNGSFGSPLVHDDKLYIVSSNVLTTLDAKTGEKVGQMRLSSSGNSEPAPSQNAGGRGGRGGRGGGFGSSDYASPIIAGDHLYYVSGTGETYVLKLSDPVEQVSVNRVTADRESFGGTPAVSHGKLYIRSDKHLYCVGE
ncbi:MAG: PQQ-binding-like beta-propeller repeat protein [Pirellulaceae bacterium]